ncbi:MAG: hypothetical protein PVH29_05175 [Candidatus Zixiibacteriota bacterium]
MPQTQLGFAGAITKIEWEAGNDFSNAPYRQFELRLCHTPLSELTANFADNYGGNTPVLAHAANPLLLAGTADSWFGFDLTTSFDYDNARNLIVELRWNNGQVETEVRNWGHDAGQNYGLISKVYEGTSGNLFSTICRFRFTYDDQAVEPTSLGRVRALYR